MRDEYLTTDEAQDLYVQAMQTVGQSVIKVDLTVVEITVLCSLLNLACRHPRVSDRMRTAGQMLVLRIAGGLDVPPIVTRVLLAGLDPANDVNRKPKQGEVD